MERLRISVLTAAKVLGHTPLSIQLWMRTGELPIGKAIMSKNGRYRYDIFKAKVEILNEYEETKEYLKNKNKNLGGN